MSSSLASRGMALLLVKLTEPRWYLLARSTWAWTTQASAIPDSTRACIHRTP